MSATPPARRARAPLARLTALLAVLLVTVVGLGMPSASATAYPSPAGGTRQVGGYIGVHYAALGGPSGVLGGPLTDELATPSGYGRYNVFAGGSIYWTPATGAWAVGGAIRDRWSSLGWEAGPLGYPTSDERVTPNGRGRYGLFQGGAVYWSAGTGAWFVRGALRDRFRQLGGPQGELGFPVSDEFAVPGGMRSNFQKGALLWNARTGAITRL